MGRWDRVWSCGGALLALAACSGPEPDNKPPDAISDTGTPSGDSGDPTTDSDDTGTPPPPPFQASCAPQADNSLRFECTVTVDPPQPVEISFSKADGTGPKRIHSSPEALSEHEIGLYMMEAESAYTWTARAPEQPGYELSGTVITDRLPDGVDLVVSASGQSTAQQLAFSSPCTDGGYAVILDLGSGRIVWYQSLTSTVFGFVDGVSITEDGTLLAIVDGSVIEVDAMGRIVMSWIPTLSQPYRVHHDLFRRGSRTYALFQEQRTFGTDNYLIDGFYVIEGGQAIAEWHLADHVVPPPSETDFPEDWSHANAIWVDESGEALVSLRHQSAILRVVADPGAPDFGSVLWTLANPESDLASDFAIDSLVGPPPDFLQQHNVFVLPDGRLTLFDNRLAPELSRILELSLDPEGGEAIIEDAYGLPLHCDFQGGALRTEAGNPLATCAPTRDAYEFDAATGEELFHLNVECNGGFGSYIPRFNPMEW